MSREKIIQSARECGAYVYRKGDSVFDSPEQLEAFYKLAQAEAFEAAAKKCLTIYFTKKHSVQEECFLAIREMAKEMK